MLFVFFLKGIAVGIVIAVPVGPVGILCIQRTIFEGRLSGVASELARLMEAIRNFLAAGATDAPLRTSISDSAETVTLLRHLKQMLANDDGAALDYLLQARERIGGVISEADLDSLQKVAGDFDFSAALECLTGIAQRYNFSLE